MKRLPALMLSVFMLTLLCLPTSASNESLTVTGERNLPVSLTIDDSQMVDVTITWEALDYTYNGSKFITESGTMPKITVQNNSVGKSIIMGTPAFKPLDNIAFTDNEFDLYFYRDSTAVPGSGDAADVTATLIESGDSTFFYAIPRGTPTKADALLGAKQLKIGNIVIKISVPQP